jgi:hypothetical protein
VKKEALELGPQSPIARSIWFNHIQKGLQRCIDLLIANPMLSAKTTADG